MEILSSAKPQPARGSNPLGQMRASMQYSFEDEHVVSLFKLLNKSNKLKLPEARRPKEVGKTDDPNYCLYYRILGHPIKSCYIFKDVFQALIDAEVLKLRPEQKNVTTNMTSLTTLQFGKHLPLATTGVVPIPKGKLKVINIDPHNNKKKALVSDLAPRGEIMWVHLTLSKTSNELLWPIESPKAKREHPIAT